MYCEFWVPPVSELREHSNDKNVKKKCIIFFSPKKEGGVIVRGYSVVPKEVEFFLRPP